MKPHGNTVEETLASHYPDQAPQLARERVEPLAEIRVYRGRGGHWHYITLGFSELAEKVSDRPALSGWGFELTFRLDAQATTEPPTWPLRMLLQLARYVFEARQPFRANHHMDLGGPVDQDAPTITALAFALDAELGEIRTPNGMVSFLQVVDLREDEEQLVCNWSVADFLAVLRTRSPLLVANPERPSLLSDRDVAGELRSRAAREGSSGATAVAALLDWRRTGWLGRDISISIGPEVSVRRNLGSLLAGSIAVRRTARIVGEGRELLLSAGDRCAWKEHGAILSLVVSPQFVAELERFLGTSDRELVSTEFFRGLRLVLRD
jgi:hypothetical protein